jgi:hypothetical protein
MPWPSPELHDIDNFQNFVAIGLICELLLGDYEAVVDCFRCPVVFDTGGYVSKKISLSSLHLAKSAIHVEKKTEFLSQMMSEANEAWNCWFESLRVGKQQCNFYILVLFEIAKNNYFGESKKVTQMLHEQKEELMGSGLESEELIGHFGVRP